ncbi:MULTISPECIES: hypothetical protein [Flavobacterium]|uniref:Uncharacterized protein n=1 Tax=Flavobacterium keumense TaxID=1306518 RepID=A0ABY8N7K1_9FLAO|nr:MULTISPECIES: hypothetical protein [Flavobacterium]WGK95158.1 hypothetical protein MG292_02705 [Flavobacterium keumense]
MISILNYYPLLTEKKIPLKPLDVHPRVYFNWKQEGLLNEKESNPNDDKIAVQRRKVFLNAFEALWVLIIKELRNLNIDLKTILELKKFLFTIVQVDENKVGAPTFEEIIDTFLETIPLELHDGVKEELSEKNMDSFLENVIDEESIIAFKYIGSLLTDVLLLKKAVSIVIIKETKTSELDFFIAQNNSNASIKEKEELYEQYATHLSKNTLINIPIVPLVSQLFEDETFEKYCVSFGLFNSHEKKLLKALNDDSCKKISVIKYDSERITFDITKEVDVKGDHAKEIRKILGLKQYEKVEVIYRNDKHLVIKNTQRENN